MLHRGPRRNPNFARASCGRRSCSGMLECPRAGVRRGKAVGRMQVTEPGPGGNLTTVESHILEMQRLHPSASGDFTGLLNDITFAAKIVARVVRRAGLVDILGSTGDVNVQGESVQKLDAYANRILRRCLGTRGQVCLIASEEDAEPLYL